MTFNNINMTDCDTACVSSKLTWPSLRTQSTVVECTSLLLCAARLQQADAAAGAAWSTVIVPQRDACDSRARPTPLASMAVVLAGQIAHECALRNNRVVLAKKLQE